MVEGFAAVELNGRQIKNTVRTANALALSEGKVLSVEEIRVVLDTVTEFDADFKGQIHGTHGLPGRSLSLGTAHMSSLGFEASPH
jgi:hypothetical protein